MFKHILNKIVFMFNSWCGPRSGPGVPGLPGGSCTGHRRVGVLCQPMQISCDDGDLLRHHSANDPRTEHTTGDGGLSGVGYYDRWGCSVGQAYMKEQ